jgi:threonine synthase
LYQLVDFKTKENVEAKDLVFTGDENPWEVVVDLEKVKKKINLDHFKQVPPSLSKYLPFLPIKDYGNFVSLRESATPLIQSKSLGKKLGVDLYFKLEGKNPTGSFKDRGSAVDISVAKEFNAKGIVLASTGNMAASCSCYAAAAKIPCFVFIPEGVSMGKLAQVISFGGRIVQVKGTYNDAARLAESVAKSMGFYLAGDYAFRVEGQKTAAFELMDQMFFQDVDKVVLPIGCGTNMAAYVKGFREYRYLGLIETIPQLIGVQAEGASSVINSFNKKSWSIESTKGVNTSASAIAVADPLDGTKALEAIYNTGGEAYSVTDQEILHSQYLLAKEEGLFVESSSASAVAALFKMSLDKSAKGQRVVCILTGDGLKDPDVILKAALKPPTIRPEEKEFKSLYDGGFFNSKNIVFLDKDVPLFSKAPTADEVRESLTQFFNADFCNEYVEKIKELSSACLAKGKTVTHSDFQDIVQDVLESSDSEVEKDFTVLDFEVSTGKDKVAKAQVEVVFRGLKHVAHAKGVGPVDAVINALSKACKGEIDFKLTNYKVDIRNKGVDALVYVELKLEKDCHSSLGQATSPDIIQASIEAFEGAYNGFINSQKNKVLHESGSQ